MQPRNTKDSSIFGKIPPQAIDVEEALLGAFLLDIDCHDIIDLTIPEMFYKDCNAKIFTAIKSLRDEKKQIDILTITEKLKKLEILPDVGGALYVTSLTSNIATGLHAGEHYYILKDKFIARVMIRFSHELLELSYSDCDIDDIEAKINDIKKFYEEQTSYSNTGEYIYPVAKESLKNARKRSADRKSGTMPGINTGIARLQNILGGWQIPDLILIAARPSMGKTAMAIFFAKQSSTKGFKTLFFSLEMNAISITDRFVLGDTDINPEKWRNGDITNFELAQYEDKSALLKSTPLIIYDESSLRPSDINSICKREKPSVIFIDYIQLMKVNRGEKFQNRNLEVGHISHELKVIAKEYKCPVIALSQLSRGLDSRGSKVPTLSDLRDSGELEQDADVVIFPYRPSVYEPIPENIGVAELIIAKHRNGRVGTVSIKHNEYINNFFDEMEPKDFPPLGIVNYNKISIEDAAIQNDLSDISDAPF